MVSHRPVGFIQRDEYLASRESARLRGTGRFRVALSVDAGPHEPMEKPVEQFINFTLPRRPVGESQEGRTKIHIWYLCALGALCGQSYERYWRVQTVGGNVVPVGKADEFIGSAAAMERSGIAVRCAGLLATCQESFVKLDDPLWDLFGKR